MPNTRITGLTEDTTPADDDLVATVDVSDTTQSAQGSTKKVQAQNLVVKKLRTSTGPAVLTVGAVADGEFLKRSGTSIISAAAGGGGLGDVVGPASATDNALARFDTTTGKLIQNSAITADDNGAVTVPEIAAPSTPATGKVVLYAKTDGLLYSKDDAGVESSVSGGSGTTINPTNNVIPYRSNSSTFADSKLSFDSSDSGRTLSDGYFHITRRGLAFGAFNDFGGLHGNRGSVVVNNGDATTPTPGSIYSPFATLPTPGGVPSPWTNSGMNYRLILTGNTTIGNPALYGGDATAPNGYRFVMMLVQNATGGWAVTWSSDFKFPGGVAPTQTAAADAVDVYEFIVYSDIAYLISMQQDVR